MTSATSDARRRPGLRRPVSRVANTKAAAACTPHNSQKLRNHLRTTQRLPHGRLPWGARVRVFWPVMGDGRPLRRWYHGEVTSHNDDDTHTITYKDGDVRDEDLRAARWRLVVPSEPCRRAAAGRGLAGRPALLRRRRGARAAPRAARQPASPSRAARRSSSAVSPRTLAVRRADARRLRRRRRRRRVDRREPRLAPRCRPRGSGCRRRGACGRRGGAGGGGAGGDGGGGRGGRGGGRRAGASPSRRPTRRRSRSTRGGPTARSRGACTARPGTRRASG